MKQFIHADSSPKSDWPSHISNGFDSHEDHPERMMFYALVGSALTWGLIAFASWGIWKLLQ